MNMTPWFIKSDNTDEFYTQERCYIKELLNCDSSPQVSLALARVEPGITTQLHALSGISETYVLRNGEGIVEVDGLQHAVESGDQIIIVADTPQRITNTGTVDLEFYCICTPRFTSGCYKNLAPDEG